MRGMEIWNGNPSHIWRIKKHVDLLTKNCRLTNSIFARQCCLAAIPMRIQISSKNIRWSASDSCSYVLVQYVCSVNIVKAPPRLARDFWTWNDPWNPYVTTVMSRCNPQPPTLKNSPCHGLPWQLSSRIAPRQSPSHHAKKSLARWASRFARKQHLNHPQVINFTEQVFKIQIGTRSRLLIKSLLLQREQLEHFDSNEFGHKLPINLEHRLISIIYSFEIIDNAAFSRVTSYCPLFRRISMNSSNIHAVCPVPSLSVWRCREGRREHSEGGRGPTRGSGRDGGREVGEGGMI